MWKTELKYGVIGALILGVYKYIEYLPVFQTIRLESGIYTGLFTYVIVITAVIMGVVKQRSKQEDMLLSFREAFRTGMIIAIIMAIVAMPFMYLNAKYFNSNEAEEMIKYITANPGDGAPPTAEELQAYYAPVHRAVRIGEDIIITGFLMSLFSAGMFRRGHADLDLAKKPKLPSTLKKVFLLAMGITLVTILVYIAWVLKSEGINTYLYDFLVDPINESALKAGTAGLSLASLVLNITYYNRVSHYRRKHNIWNILMIIISGLMFFIFLWSIIAGY